MTAHRQRGSAVLLVVMVLLLLAAILGGMAVRGSSSDLRLAVTQREGVSGFYCAETGLNLARDCFAQNVERWNGIFSGATTTLANCVYPSPITALYGSVYPLRIDLDSDGTEDVTVTLQDNVDELTNNFAVDSDLTAIMQAECKNTPYKLTQIVTYQGRGTEYGAQLGKSASNTGNQN